MSAAFQIFTQPSQQALDTAASVLSGATLTFTLTGTSTPTNAYSDSARANPVANPLPANAAGVWIPIYLDPAVSYRIVLKTQAGAVLQTWDPANENVLAYLLAALTQSVIGTILYPQTAAEIAAAVTPVNYTYPPLCVDRYGTNAVPGTTSMKATFQAAFDTAKECGGTVTYGATGPYLIDGELDLTIKVGQTKFAFTLRGEGHCAAYTQNAPYRPPLIFKHTGHCFDCTGNLGLTFDNVCATTDTVTYPKTCWLLARNTDGRSQSVKFRTCRVIGYFSEGVVYNYGSEDDEYHGCQFYNYAGVSGSKVMWFTATNIHSQASTFTTIATGNQSTIDHKIFGGEFMNFAAHADADVIYCDAVASLKVFGPWMMAGTGAAAGRALVYVNTVNGPTNSCVLTGITAENAGANSQKYGVLFESAVATPSYWLIEGCALPNSVAMIASHANVICDDFHVKCCTNQSTGGGIALAGLVQNSHIDELANNISIGTSNDNVLSAAAGNLTVTTRNRDSWSCPGTLSWTPVTSALTITGALTVNNKRVQYFGSQVTVTMDMSAATSIVCADGTLLGGLPIAQTVDSALCIVANRDTHALIGIGRVSGTNIALPAINVGAGVVVTVTTTYFCA